jgi:hypothetical protein
MSDNNGKRMSEMKRTHNNEETIMNDGERGNKQNRRK